MQQDLIKQLSTGLQDGSIIPYLGPEALLGSLNAETGAPIPADSDSLIYAMNNGRPMAPKLMYEFPRAAMNLELKKGRSFVNRFLDQTYGKTEWTRAPLHDWIKTLQPQTVIDINRDTQLQDSYKGVAHNLVVGIARIGGTDYRFKLYTTDGGEYREIQPEEVDASLPLLIKPMGTPFPEPSYIASDADYVDYITELMGGFGVPKFFKEYRTDKQYLLVGLSLNRDTERMVLTDITYGAAPERGWVVIAEPTDKERRFCKRIGLTIIEQDLISFLQDMGVEDSELAKMQSSQEAKLAAV